MPKQSALAKLNPVYLASRHAGVTFMFVALGFAAGMAWRCLVQPVRYSSRAESAAVAAPAGARLDWEAKQREWRGLLADPRTRAILANNLRHAVKLAAFRDADLDPDRLAGELILHDAGAAYSASLLQGVLSGVGPVVSVRTDDIAATMDFQSLAAVVADLDPPRDAVNWDFSFFRQPSDGIAVLVRPAPGDRYFQVFNRLYRILNPDAAEPSPEEAWRAAAAEVAVRLARETKFAGGGGFGPIARRELMREIASIPILAANGLYAAGGWAYGEDEFADEVALWTKRWTEQTEITLVDAGGGEGVAAVQTAMTLYPLAYPRDTALTRVTPLATATLLAYLAARESMLAPAAAPVAVSVAAPASPPPPSARRTVRPRPAPAAVVVKEVVDAVAAQEHREKIEALEASLRAAGLERTALIRRLDTARENARRLAAEAIAARERADRFKERYDAATLAEDTAGASVPPETARLLEHRDGLARRLASLLQYCTEEHPFVKEVRRDSAAIDILLDGQNPAAVSAREAEIRATRLANLYLEWETASASAHGLEERAKRQNEAVECLADELTALEQAIARDDNALALAKDAPLPVIRIEEPVAEDPEPEPEPEPEPVPPAPVQPAPEVMATSHLRLAAAPTRIPLQRRAPGWEAVIVGMFLGLVAGVAAAVAREVAGRRFYSAFEATRLTGYPVLAALPAYDARSYRDAARTMKGDIVPTAGKSIAFTPLPVEMAEPQPAARRGRVRPARRIPRLLAWFIGLALLLAGFTLLQRSHGGFAQPRLWFSGELGLPVFSVQQERVEGEP